MTDVTAALEVLDGRRPWCVITGDCLDVLPTLPAGCIDLVITSPPYNLGNTSGGGMPGKKPMGHYDPACGMAKRGGMGKWSGGALAHGYEAHSDNMPHEEYIAWQKQCLSEMWHVIADDGAIYYNHKPRILSGRLVTPFDYNPGLPVRQVVIWSRAGGINFAPTHYVPTHEWLMILAQDAFRLKSKGASGVGDVWYIPQEENPDHPAPFPVRLPRRILETTDAEVVLDPFAGIASTGVACLEAGKRFIGIELSERYAAIARTRLAAAERDQRDSLFPAKASAAPPAPTLPWGDDGDGTSGE